MSFNTSLRDLPPDDLAPVIPYEDYMTYIFDWKQGQHVGLVGPTEAGKSTALETLLEDRSYVTFFATKPYDPVLLNFADIEKYVRITDWPPKKYGRIVTAEKMPKRLLWPNATDINAQANQTKVFRKAIADIYAQGGWTVVWDEFWMMTKILDLEQESRIFLQQARSNNISFVMGAQRPSRIPLEMFDQSTWLFFFRDNDEVNLKRISGIGWLASGPIRSFVANLERFQCLAVNTRTGQMYRTRFPAK